MKYLADDTLNELSRSLSHSSAECTVHSRIEAYSCKPIGKDKKLWKAIDGHYEEEIALAHPLGTAQLDSPFGSLDQHQARRTFCLLIATLNVAFPDHDFSDVSPDHFMREENGGATVLSALSTTLLNLRDSPSAHGAAVSSRSYSSFPTPADEFFPMSPESSTSPSRSPTLSTLHPPPSVVTNTHPTLFRLLNDVVTLSECEVYSYSPDIYSDPHAGGDSDSDDTDSTSSDSDSDVWDEYDDYDDQVSSDQDAQSRRRSAAPWDTSPELFPFDEDEPSFSSPKSSASFYPHDSYSSKEDSARSIPVLRRKRKRGGLLWSSHWFFFHKKEKKILFISVWARKKEASSVWVAGDDAFEAWEGAIGAGARAFDSEQKARTMSAGNIGAIPILSA